MLFQMIIYGVFLMIFVFAVIYQLNMTECNKQKLVGENIKDILISWLKIKFSNNKINIKLWLFVISS